MNDEDFSKTAFIQVGAVIGLSDINQDLKYLMNGGYKYVFIDEVALIEDFIEGAALFSDIFAACGMKIVLSGTDSLGFFFSEDEQLYDRCIFIHNERMVRIYFLFKIGNGKHACKRVEKRILQ